MDDFNRSNTTLNNAKTGSNQNEIYTFYNQNNYQFIPQSLPPPPLPPPPPPQQNISYFTYQSTPQPVLYQYSNYQNLSFLNSSLNSSTNYYQTSNSYIPNYQNYYPYPSSPSKATSPLVQKINDENQLTESIQDNSINNEGNSSMKRSSAVLPIPKYIRPKICKSPLVIQSVQSKKVVKPKAQQAVMPPESARRVVEQLPEYAKKSQRSQPPPPPPPPSYESSISKKLPPPSAIPPPPPSVPPQIFHHHKIHKNLLNQVLENSFNSEKTNTSKNFEFDSSFNTSGNNNSVFNHTGIQDENLQNYQYTQSNLYTFFDRKKQLPPPPYPGKIEEMDVQFNMPPPPQTIPPPPPPIPYEQAIMELEQQRLNKNSNLSSNSSNTSTFTSIRQCSPQAFKFFMEQHAENVLKHHKAREYRRLQLENEMQKVCLPNEVKEQMRKLLRQKETNYLRLRRAKMNKSMFEHIKTLGIGAFGQVDLVRKKDDPQRLYAMKILHKSDVFNRNQAAHVKAERDILAEADNEWVVKLYYSFQDDENLYFVMDYVPGGDLMNLLIKKGVFSEKLAQFYIGELTCAIESVHSLGFIHRDIKPDNILIDRNGHIKLTDFGLCTGFHWTHNTQNYIIDDTPNRVLDKKINKLQKNSERRLMAHSLVGTPNYIAPEILSRKGYTKSCDWWSVGVILYEMIVGEPPFRDETALGTQAKVINYKNTLKIPDDVKISPEAKDLIFKLCTDAEIRLGADGIKTHPFFKGFDFGPNLRRSEALYKPTIKHATDTSNFEPIDSSILADRKARIEQMNLTRQLQSQNLFNGYSNIYRTTGDYSDLNGSQNGSTNPVLYEFTFRRFFDEENKFFTGAMDEYENDNGFKSFIKNISANQNLLKSDSDKMDFANSDSVLATAATTTLPPQIPPEKNLSPTLTSMMASVTTSCKTLNEENYPTTDKLASNETGSKIQLKESTNLNSYPTTESLNENSMQLGKENVTSSTSTNKTPIYI